MPEAATQTDPVAPAAPIEAPTEPVLFNGLDLSGVKLWKEVPEPSTEAEPPAEVGSLSGPQAEAALPEPDKKAVGIDRLAILAKQERKLREREAALKPSGQERTELEEFRKLKALAPNKPFEVMKALGLDYGKATDEILQGEPSEAAKLKAELADLRKEYEAGKQKQAEREADLQIENFKRTITETIKGDTERFELIHVLGEESMVFEVIAAEARKSGTVMTIEEAAAEVEAYLEENEGQRLDRALTTKKFKSRLSAVSPKQPASRPQANGHPKTLTNAQSAVVPPRVEAKPKTRDEEIHQAARLIKFRPG